MNRQEIRLAVQARIDDTDGVRTTEPELNRYIEDGYTDLAERTGAVVRTVNLALSPTQRFVATPTNMLYPLLMRDLASGLPIDFEDWTFLDKLDFRFVRRTAQRPEIVASWGLGEFLLSSAYGGSGGSVEVIYAAIPGPLADNAEPELPVQYHEALVHYTHARTLLKDAHGDIAQKRIGKAKGQFSEYYGLANSIQRWNFDRLGIRTVVMGSDTLRIHGLDAFQDSKFDWQNFSM